MFLRRIVERTLIDLEQRKQELLLDDLKQQAAQQSPPRDLLAALQYGSRVHLIAEVKRASPSKGMLAPDMDPLALARTYEANGASAISVLTEPHFFLGSPDYLRAIKEAIQVPVLRKDFIVDEYQVYEARAWGADALLLICAILDDRQLHGLLHLARSLQMHCLVEVHNQEEAQRAVAAGAQIIGVNSRDLVTFQMHPSLIRDLRRSLPADRVIVAESGIHSEADARRLARYDVQAMLVGESLVVSPDVPSQMQMLLRGANESTQVKICGLRTPEAINAAIEAGADMLGIIFYEPSHRYVPPEQVRSLFEASTVFQQPPKGQTPPDIVGVFVNKDADYVNSVIEHAGLNFVQLHGTESPEISTQIQRPVIKSLQLQSEDDLVQVKRYRDKAWRLLLDTPTPHWGGTGQTHDWQLAHRVAQQQKILLAGGLTIENVRTALQQVHPWSVDVSSGIETNKQKDVQKIRTFLQAVRTLNSKKE